jgi:hypothetical protein
MKRLIAALALVAAALPAPAFAQGNDDDYTPLNSRIKRDRQFPTEPSRTFAQRDLTRVERQQSRDMAGQFAYCLYDRSNEDALSLLRRTDYGFVNFEQIGMENGRAAKVYPIDTCLSRVARTHDTGVSLRWTPASIRRWMLQAAYARQYPNGATWLVPGNVIRARTFPLSANNPRVTQVVDVADCLVAGDPHTADFFFRSASGSAEEREALQPLAAALGPCLPQGLRLEISPPVLREWVGEALWHASQNSAPPPTEPAQDAR